MTQTAYVKPGAIACIRSILDEIKPNALFLVADPKAYPASGAQTALAPILEGRSLTGFDTFEPNPKHGDVERGVERFRDQPADLLIAVGGGTAIDMAKLIGICAAQKGPVRKILDGSTVITEPGPPLVAIPTTAGTGSEATRFAVVYIDGHKHSLTHPHILPDYALVDPDLTTSLPPDLTAHTGLDALSQAIESLWNVNATDQSTAFAEEALTLAWDNLALAVHRPTPEIRYNMSRAAHLAGCAINITKTTAPHAISYTLTSRHKVPHGLAVALTLGPLLAYNSRVTDQDVADPKGSERVRTTLSRINRLLGCADARESREKIRSLMHAIGCPTTLGEVGVRTDSEVQILVDTVNLERLGNNPRKLTPEALKQVLKEIL